MGTQTQRAYILNDHDDCPMPGPNAHDDRVKMLLSFTGYQCQNYLGGFIAKSLV